MDILVMTVIINYAKIKIKKTEIRRAMKRIVKHLGQVKMVINLGLVLRNHQIRNIYIKSKAVTINLISNLKSSPPMIATIKSKAVLKIIQCHLRAKLCKII